MSESLFTTPPTLPDRQAHALKLIRHRQPVRSDELGAHLHAFRQAHGGNGHPADETCDYCVSEGRSVGEALAKKMLVRYVRGEGWVTVEWQGSGPGQVVPASSQLGVDDPWPEDLF